MMGNSSNTQEVKTLVIQYDSKHNVQWATNVSLLDTDVCPCIESNPGEIPGFSDFCQKCKPCLVGKALATGCHQYREIEKSDDEIIFIEVIPIRDRDGNITGATEIVKDVTQSKQALNLAFETQSNFDILYNLLDDFVFMLDEEGRILDGNSTVIDRLGYSKNELRIKPFLSLINPEKKDLAARVFHKMLEGKESHKLLSIQSKTGREIIIETSIRKSSLNGIQIYFCIGNDVTDTFNAKQALENRLKIEGLISNLSTRYIQAESKDLDDNIIYALQTIGRFINVNRAYVYLFSNDGKSMINTHEWTTEDTPPLIRSNQRVPLHSIPVWAEHLTNHENIYVPSVHDMPPELEKEKDRLERMGTVSLVIVPMVYNGATIGLIGFDSTQAEKQWEYEDIVLLETLANVINHALARRQDEEDTRRRNTELKEALQVKNEFMAMVSHELRTPLVPIIGFADLLMEGVLGELPEAIIEPIKVIQERSNDLKTIIDDLLLVSMTDKGNATRTTDVHSLVNLIQLCIAQYHLNENSKPVHLDFKGEEIYARVEPKKFHKALKNIIDNSIKFTDDEVEIMIEAHENDGEGLITISDNGPGIEKEHHEKIFDRFYQVENIHTREKGGTGLGLSITRDLLNLMDGKVWVESVPGKGATFKISLPVAGEDDCIDDF